MASDEHGSEMPLCRECERMKGEISMAECELFEAEYALNEAETLLIGFKIRLKSHQEEPHGEDDPWLLHKLAEKRGQLALGLTNGGT